MTYFKDNFLSHFKTKEFYLFCSGLTLGTFAGKKIINYYKKKKNIETSTENTLYFLLHFLFNMYSVSKSLGDVKKLLNSPLVILDRNNSLSFYVILFHLYHIFLTKGNIAFDELLHHFKVFILCPILCIHYTNLCNFGMFFMTGLPGGITYFLLFLKNLKLIKSDTEKKVSKHLNLWLRAPGCVITSYIVYLNYVNNNFGKLTFIHKVGIYVAMFGNLWNGMYFAKTIVESSYKNELRTL
jgi:hypothetical protein